MIAEEIEVKHKDKLDKLTKKVLEYCKEDRPSEYEEVKQYIDTIEKFGLIAIKEENELINKAIQGDTASREKVINSNLILIVVDLLDYFEEYKDFEMMDIIQIANEQLIYSVKIYNPENNVTFRSYVHFVRYKVLRILNQLRKTGAYGTLCGEKTVESLDRIMKHKDTLDALISDELELDEIIIQEELKEATRRFIDNHVVSPRDRKVIDLRFGITSGSPMTLEEVGKQFGITKSRARQLELKILSTLRHPKRSETLKIYWR